MRILGPIVPSQPLLVPSRQSHCGLCRAVRAKLIGHQNIRRKALFLKQLAHQFQGCSLVAPWLHQQIENLAFVVNPAPEPELPARYHDGQSSGPGEFHPQALTDPDVSVSAHPAPTVRPLPDTAIANVRTAQAPDALRPGPSAAHAEYALSGVDISTSPSMPGVYRDALALGKVPICDTGHSS